jgi:hypothetical protein
VEIADPLASVGGSRTVSPTPLSAGNPCIAPLLTGRFNRPPSDHGVLICASPPPGALGLAGHRGVTFAPFAAKSGESIADIETVQQMPRLQSPVMPRYATGAAVRRDQLDTEWLARNGIEVMPQGRFFGESESVSLVQWAESELHARRRILGALDVPPTTLTATVEVPTDFKLHD